MSRYTPDIDVGSFKHKVFVLTGEIVSFHPLGTYYRFFFQGASNGIGAATVERLCALEAKVVFGDIQVEAGEKQAQKLSSPNII